MINLFKFIILSAASLQQQQQSFLNKICQSGIREDNTNYIHCARRNLHEIPPLNKNNLIYDELVLTDNQITELNEQSFARIKVKKVYLNNNPIRFIDNRTFIRLANNLEELWLDSDIDEPINGIPYAISYYLRNLLIIHLKNFNIRFIESLQLQKLQRLEILGLQACNIRSIDALGFNGLVNLKELYLDSNQLDRVPTEALNELKSLRILSLAQNNIKIISSNSFARLVQLDLSYNGLRQIDNSAFNTLNSTLEKLYLQNNELNSYNLNFIKSLTKLIELNLDFNILKTLTNPSTSDLIFKNSKNLQYLSLQGNQIQFEAKQELIFYGLSNLQRLNLARNNIKYLPSNLFQPLRQLQSLILDRNQVENLNDMSVYNGLEHNLVNISLQNMKINRQEKLTSLKSLYNLERIRLGFNDLEIIDLAFFLNISKNLQLLDLQNNKIHTIDYITDNNNSTLINKSLLEFDLTNNKLCTFNAKSILGQLMPKLKYLSLTQNPLFCDCLLTDLYSWLMTKYDKEFLTFIQWSCTGPIDNLNKKFTSLSLNDFKCNDEINKTRSIVCVNEVPMRTAAVTTTTTTTTTSGNINLASYSAARTSINEAAAVKLDENLLKIPHIVDININSYLNTLLINWNIDLNNENLIGFRVTVDDLTNKILLKTASLDKLKRSLALSDLNLSHLIQYSICISVVHIRGYDKYCRDFQLNEILSTTELAFVFENNNFETKMTKQQENQTTSSYFTNSTILITIVIVLIGFIIFIIMLSYLFIRKCNFDNNNTTKSTVADTMYSFSKPISSTNQSTSRSNKSSMCCCIKLNTSSNTVDTSTVSSTLSSVTNQIKENQQQQQQHQKTLLVPINDLNLLASNDHQQLSSWTNTHKSIHIPLLTTATSNSTSPTSSFNFIQHPGSSGYSYNFNQNNSNNYRLEPEHVYCEIPSNTLLHRQQQQNLFADYNNSSSTSSKSAILIFEPTTLSTSSTANLIPINQRLLQHQQYQHFLNNNQNFNVSII